MIILGLGANAGDRLANLRKAYQELQSHPDITILQTSPVYQSDALLPENPGENWDKPYLNVAIRSESSLSPDELLAVLKKIEKSIGRQPDVRHWGPREIDIDILAWDNKIIHNDHLDIPHQHLTERPFALWPLADVAPCWKHPEEKIAKTAEELAEKWGSRFTGDAPLHTKQIYHRIDMPELVGVINVTPDSFSDGGKYMALENALQQALLLAISGARILDIGAESTAPHSKPINAKEEWARLEPFLSELYSAKSSFPLFPKISIDARYPETAEKAFEFGIDWINDVTGLSDPLMRRVVATANVDCVMMHHISIPADKNQIIPRNCCAVQFTLDWAKQQIDLLTQEGIALDKIIMDPGIGFGKAPEQSFELIKRIAEFKSLGVRLLIGHSRKSFMKNFTHYPASERDIETFALSLFLANQPIDYLRVHNVEMCARGLKIWGALR